MPLSDAITAIDSFIADLDDDLRVALGASSNHNRVTAGGQVENATMGLISAPSMDLVKQNPLAAAGIDVTNEIVTKVTQQLVVMAGKKIDTLTSPFRKSVQETIDTFFSAVALASSAQVEVVMEIARTNARKIISDLDEKDARIKSLRDNLILLHNAAMLVTSNQSFFTEYFDKLVTAYGKVQTADTNLHSVLAVLSQAKQYNNTLYDQSLVLLTDARDLILPDRTAELPELSALKGFITDVINKPSNKKSWAAVLTVPVLSYQIGQDFLKYTALVTRINSSLGFFLTALDDFTKKMTVGDMAQSMAVSHISSGVQQLDSLRADMKAVLFPPGGVPTTYPDSYTYPGRVTSAATSWGIRLTPLIEWFKVQPGKAVQSMAITGESVKAYKDSIAALRRIQTRKSGLATIAVDAAREDIAEPIRRVGALLIFANTLVATQTSKTDITARFMQVESYFQGVLGLDGEIRAALLPFVSTSNQAVNDANKIVRNLTKLSKELGLDRVTKALQTSDIKGFLSITADTATSVGAALAGVSAVSAAVLSTYGAAGGDTEKVVETLSNYTDSLKSRNAAKQVEASRSASSTRAESDAQAKNTHDGAVEKAQRAKMIAESQGGSVPTDSIKKVETLIGGLTAPITALL